jgi:phospholipid/cholesterol/gamma-HCH transport system substrate-binding protein
VSPASLSEVVATGTRALENIAMLAENVNAVVENFSEASGERQIGELLGSLAKLDDIFEEIRNGDGLLHRVIYGASSDTQTTGDFLEATIRLNSILEKVDQGEGTMGLLINDPTLYEDLKTLIGGAQRSVVVRSLIRMSVDDGN